MNQRGSSASLLTLDKSPYAADSQPGDRHISRIAEVSFDLTYIWLFSIPVGTVQKYSTGAGNPCITKLMLRSGSRLAVLYLLKVIAIVEPQQHWIRHDIV